MKNILGSQPSQQVIHQFDLVEVAEEVAKRFGPELSDLPLPRRPHNEPLVHSNSALPL
jgi:hypothetical protein